mmetsp:Transcript_47710/g.97082  ORF Transcript_47710/g.97082 Transcript_47710/m.97082 type:complete len:98 (+) Transcript_47710:61-354(+)
MAPTNVWSDGGQAPTQSVADHRAFSASLPWNAVPVPDPIPTQTGKTLRPRLAQCLADDLEGTEALSRLCVDVVQKGGSATLPTTGAPATSLSPSAQT